MTEPTESRPDGVTDLPPQEHDIVGEDEDRRDRGEENDSGASGLTPVPPPHSFAEAIDIAPGEGGGKD